MSCTFVNGKIVTPDGVLEHGGLTFDGDRITRVDAAAADLGAAVIDLKGGWLLPGFIDTQVNGGGGVLFNDDPSAATIAAIGAAHAPYGTTGFLPTLISDDLECIDAAMRAVETAIAHGVPGVLGIHIEGPFISEKRKGIHNPDKFRILDEAGVKLLTSLKAGKTLVTLAPEHCAPKLIQQLVAAGVIVAAGHTNASYQTTRMALDLGMTGFTHLFNAMSPLSHRAPGVVGAALEDQTSYCGLIVDGQHVDPVALRIALRAKPIDRFMLVTDAMPSVGAAQKSFMLQGKRIHVDHSACFDDNGTLAGSDLDMASAVRNTVNQVGVSVTDAATMAATAPARFLHVDHITGALAPGLRADFVWLDNDLAVKGVWIAGAQNLAERVAA